MSHEASAWAFKQELPAKLVLVLLALADQAHAQTGHVCYGRHDQKYLAEKSRCGIRTFQRYMVVLERHGYIRSESGQSKGQENEYWLQLERDPACYGAFTWRASEPTQPQDIGYAKNKADTETTTNLAHPLRQQVAHPLRQQVAHHKNQRTKELKPADEKPKIGFSRQAQDLDRAQAATDLAKPKPPEPGDMPGWTFVIEGTRWWHENLVPAYRAMGKPINSTIRGHGKYAGKTGIYVRNEVWARILKPNATAPPPDPLSDESVAEIQATG